MLFNRYFDLEQRLYQLSQYKMNNEGDKFIASAVVHIKDFYLLLRNVSVIASHRNLAQIDTFKDQIQIYIEPVKRLAFAASNLELQSKH